jgi:hypothetical protein
MTLYITDLDGTLLNYAGKLKPRASEMLSRMINKGVLFSYATARRHQTAGFIMQDVAMNIPVITMNGVFIVEPVTGKKLFAEPIPERGLDSAKKFITDNNETPIVYAHIDGRERVSFLKQSHKAVKGFNDTRKGDPFRHACDNYDELFEGEIHYITFLNPESDIAALNAVFNRENGFNAVTYEDTYPPNYVFYEAWSINASKATAALKLKALTGADRIIAFGDNYNDIPLFEAADECYAVDNAVDALKELATGVIPSNESMGVPLFIERRTARVWDYTPPKNEPNAARFASALQAEKTHSSVGTLNEKATHAALKYYFSTDPDREAKIGSYIADAAGENGIYEIQTAGWNALRSKLDVFLEASHVTVVYPFEQRVHNIYIHENTGELLKKSPVRNNKSMTGFFLELYRIKAFLTHPNLTVCLTGLEIEKVHLCKSADKLRERRQKKVKKPLALLTEVHLNSKEDYRRFLPDELPETFTKVQFQKLVKNSDASIILGVLEYLLVVQKVGKKGNAFIYAVSPR